MARLLSLNVGLPREVTWNGKTVRTAVWKFPVEGRRMVRKLNVDGDGQADLAGHGGEQRAVFVYQMDSYHYWERFLERSNLVSANSEKISRSTDSPMMKSELAIDIELALRDEHKSRQKFCASISCELLACTLALFHCANFGNAGCCRGVSAGSRLSPSLLRKTAHHVNNKRCIFRHGTAAQSRTYLKGEIECKPQERLLQLNRAETHSPKTMIW
jgi:hypothetical protein